MITSKIQIPLLFFSRIQLSVQSQYLNAYVGFVRWLAIRLEFIGACIVFAAVLLAVISRNMDSETITAGAAGLSITYALSVSL